MSTIQDFCSTPKTKSAAPSTFFGRFETPAGQIVNFAFDGLSSLTAEADCKFEKLVENTTGLANAFSLRQGRSIAFIGIGFGPPPIGAFDKPLWKAIFIEAEHPRQPEGTPEGGEFRVADAGANSDSVDNPIDGLNSQNAALKDLSRRVGKNIARKLFKSRCIAALRLMAGIGADAIPIAGEVFDAYEIAQTIEEGVALEGEITAAQAYLRNGPQALDSLRVSAEDQSFSSVDAFKKDSVGKVYGPAGDGYEYHHIVGQGGANAQNIPPELLHSTENMIRIPKLLHEEISAAYSSEYMNTDKTLREWLSTQPYEVQREEGIKVMRNLGIIK